MTLSNRKILRTLFRLLAGTLYAVCLSACDAKEPLSENRDAEIESPVIANDLSNQKVTAIAEDTQGHIWIGTFRGLNKNNVHDYHQYFCTDDSLGLPDNQITHLLRDSKNRFWVGTVNGVCLYTDKDNFRIIPIEADNKNVRQILEDRNGRIFFNTGFQLYAYHPREEKITCVLPGISLGNTSYAQCHIALDNNLWVMTSTGLCCYDLSTLQLKESVALNGYPYYSYLHNNELWITGNHTLSIFDTRTRSFKPLPQPIAQNTTLCNADIDYIHPYGNNGLLLNTARHGMFYYNPGTGSVTRQDENGFPFEMPRFRISRMFTDSQQNLWIGSVDQGYTVCYHYKERFNNDNYLRSELNNKSVVSLSAGKDHKLWISTLMDGIYVYDTKSSEIRHIDPETFCEQEKQKAIYANQLMVDSDNNLWMTITNNEVLKARYTPDGQLKIEERHQIFLPMSIAQSPDGTIWIGTATVNVYALRPGKKEFEAMKLFEGFTFVPGLAMMDNRRLMVTGFYQPIKHIDIENLETGTADIAEEDLKACIRRSVFVPTALYKDTYGILWIGTVGNGLMCYHPETGRMTPMPGTSCLDISGIEEDLQGNLWISTQYGLSKYDRTAGRFTNYYAADGIGGNQFYDRASCRLPDGTLAFGGTHGMTFFNPVETPFKYDVPLTFENLKIHNKLVYPGKNAIIDKDLSYQPDVYLKHSQTSFSISFAALDYSEYERIHYHYQLEGIDRYWINAHTNREAYYANLPTGTYMFKVKITNEDQSIIGEEKQLRIIVKPAPWNTWWARCAYALVIIGIAGTLIHSWRRVRIEKETACRAEQEKAQEQKMNKTHMSYFTNISHEFRTPLTTMLGSIRQLCAAPANTEPNRELLNVLQDGILRMLQLVNQLLDFNKLDNDNLGLEVQQTNLASTIKRIISFFNINAQSKNITLSIQGLHHDILYWADEDKVEKILSNLLSNAMKFTPTGGEIEISFAIVTRQEAEEFFCLTEQDKSVRYIRISVTNTGENIPEEQLEKIFERFYQIKGNKGTYNWGPGIGLYYARRLARLHHGHLKAANRKEGNGAMFILILPADDFSYTKEERFYGKKTLLNNTSIEPAKIEPDAAREGKTSPKTILIVDDDPAIMHYLQILLTPHYHIISRLNSTNIFQTIVDEAPDLILSDVLMPDKDGYQLCKEIKANLQFCHIPVILVTAKSTVENQIEGLHTGADAYVPKPFEPAYLLALIESLLTNRDKMRSFLTNNTRTSQMKELALTPKDEAFMTELYKLMENELDNPELDITRMAELLKISRTKFYYKVKGLTGKNPSVFFRTYKLNRAAELIKEGTYTISEIADMTGFNTLPHFSTCFKKQFGINPSEYQ